MPRPILVKVLDAPSGWPALDAVAAPLKRVVDTVLPPGRMRDLLHGKAIGHPTHPPLAQAVLAGWTGAAVLGVAELVSGSSTSRDRSARRLLALVGLVGAAPAVTAGLSDWSQLHEDQQRTGLVHAAVMSTAGALSVAAQLSRRRGRSAWLDVGAGLVATLGGALGGHLAYRWSAGPNHAEAFPHVAKEGWTRVCRADDLAQGELHLGMVGDEPIVLARVGDRIIAMGDRCSHLAGPLHEGELTTIGDALCVVCPWHHSAFRIDDGEVAAGPAYAPQPTLETRTVFGWVDVQTRQLPGVSGR